MSEVAVKKELLEGWVEAPLEDCVDILDSQRVPLNSKQRADRIEGKAKSELYPYYGATGSVGFIDDFIFEGEHILLGEDAAPFFDKSKTVAYVVNGKFWVNNHAHILNARRSITSNKYLLHYLNSFNYKGYVNGTTRLKLNQRRLKTIPVPLAPPEQQKRIVAKIEELFSHIDAGIAALNKAKQLLKQYRQSVLKAAVTGELTKQWRKDNKDKLEPASQLLDRILQERRQKWEAKQLEQFKAKGKEPKDDKWKGKYKEPTAADIGNLPEIPAEWVWATLPQLGELNRGKSKHRPRNDPSLYGGEYPFVQTGDVRAANTWLKEYSQTYSDKGLSQSRLWEKGTMCITIAANIADTAILDFKACFPDSVVGFVPLNESVNVEVIEFFVRTVKSNLEKYAPATAQKNINLAILESVAMPLLPVKEQAAIINMLKYKMSMADRLDDELDRQRIKAEKNKQSILVSAFSGGISE